MYVVGIMEICRQNYKEPASVVIKKNNNCMAVLLINNFKEIPNIILHDECFEHWKNKTDELCDDIVKAHDDYKRLNEIFG